MTNPYFVSVCVSVGICECGYMCVCVFICSLGSHKMKASALTTYSNSTVNIADAGTVYFLYTRQLCKLVLCAT